LSVILAFSNQSAALPSALDTHKQNSLLAKSASQTNSMLQLFLVLGQQHIMGA
jgi:cellobiose-specific phosphotransferase system component IIA